MTLHICGCTFDDWSWSRSNRHIFISILSFMPHCLSYLCIYIECILQESLKQMRSIVFFLSFFHFIRFFLISESVTMLTQTNNYSILSYNIVCIVQNCNEWISNTVFAIVFVIFHSFQTDRQLHREVLPAHSHICIDRERM